MSHQPPRASRGVRWARRGVALAATLGVTLVGNPASPAFASVKTRDDAPAKVIVREAAGADGRVEAAVRRAGGQVTAHLGIINSIVATVPSGAVQTLSNAPGVAGISPDTEVRPQGEAYAPANDGGSMYNLTQLSGAQQYWQKGFTGKGVDVALIDSGVAPVDGLVDPDKVLHGPDLSFESQAENLANLDTFGHGTHMAGIIGGRSSSAVAGNYVGDTANFLGMAPDARIISLKVADAHGATDVSQVIAAIDWVVQHRNDPGMNIRVLNLSYGTDSGNGYEVDPLAYAAEQAWKAGIFVVAAAGNAGAASKFTGSVTMPAQDPNVMAVGAVDTAGTDTMKDDEVADYSSSGSKSRRVDIVAPGSHVVSLRAPGSFIDTTYSGTGAVTDNLFRGSGTSQATALTSGAAALVVQQRPTITPSQLKALFLDSAHHLPGASKEAQGTGELDLGQALTAKTSNAPTFSSAPSTGTGSLDAARGSEHLVADGVALTGEQDIFGKPWNSAAMAAQEAAGTSWSDGTWNGTEWSGSRWSGSRWSGTEWSGSRWSGSRWSDTSWSSSTWLGSRWSGSRWSDSSWN